MSLADARELENTRRKLARLEEHYEASRNRSTPNGELREMSLRSLRRLMDQLREEIARFESRLAAPHTLDPLELDVLQVIEGVGTRLGDQGARDARWTFELKRDLAQLATEPRYGYRVCATGHDRCEWLFDMIWLAEADGVLRDVPLVLESEWKESGLEYDFLKLVVARARHRFLVFELQDPARIPAKMDDLCAAVMSFRQRIPGDRYVFAGWDFTARRFVHRLLVVPWE